RTRAPRRARRRTGRAGRRPCGLSYRAGPERHKRLAPLLNMAHFTSMADLYSQQNVARGASEAEIKKAYRKLAKELHPDKNKDNPKATERFSKVTHAYDLLTDKDKRAQYDRGEIDEEGNPRMPFGFGGAGGGRGGGFR